MNFVAWSAVVGTFLPLAISLVKGAHMTKGLKQFIALIVSIVAAVVTVGANEGWVFTTWQEFAEMALTSFTVVFSLAQTTYLGFWEDRAVEARLEKVGSH